ncbi:hypothetical protein C8R45DRAFT_1107066 [Mycena sanguinolenta]|nr:hypothetical protein C8R45DRAFT_1107066 [Mycena sanguinolenta]
MRPPLPPLPIHHLIHTFPIFKNEFETIDPRRRFAPMPAGVLSASIADSKEEAREEMDRVISKGGVCIFTDGSGFERGVRSAAVVMVGQTMGTRRWKHLGTETARMVFESEVVGAILALDIIAATPRLTDVDIFMDCHTGEDVDVNRSTARRVDDDAENR